MEKLFDIARRKSDSAEIYYLSYLKNSIEFENSALTRIESTIQSGYCLRIIKGGYVGMSYTKNLLDREGLVENALSSLKGKVKGAFSFPKSGNLKKVKTYDESLNELTSQRVIQDLKAVCNFVGPRLKAKGQLNLTAEFGSKLIKIVNSEGLSVEDRSSSYVLIPKILFPNSYASIVSLLNSTSYQTFPEQRLSKLVELYTRALPEVSLSSGKLPVIFSPHSLFAPLIWRINAGTNAKSVYEDMSPIKDKVGEKIFSDQLTLIDDPHREGRPDSRSFDDEGTSTTPYTLVEKGVLREFYTNLNYAGKLGIKPTGHGFKRQMWGGDPISLRPMPALTNEMILPGDEKFENMIQKLNRGVLVVGGLGAHSGNILNGDFSIGLNPGLYVEKGEIVGRLKDAMIAGNVYDLMKNIISVENKVHESWGGCFPAMCFDEVQVSVG